MGEEGVEVLCVYLKQTSQIRCDLRERSWKPSCCDPFFSLSDIPSDFILPSVSQVSSHALVLAASISSLCSVNPQLPPSVSTSHSIHYPYFLNIIHMFGASSDRFLPPLCGLSPLPYLTLLPLLHLPCPSCSPLSRTSLKRGQHSACNATSFLCLSAALWLRLLIQGSINWPITFHVFPQVVSQTWHFKGGALLWDM